MTEITLAALRAEGLHLQDPARFHYLEVLESRLQAQPPAVRALLTRRLQDALALPFLGLHEASALQALVTTQARRLQADWDYRVRLGNLDAICRMVALGAGVAVVPHAVAEREARTGHVRRLPLTDAWAARQLLLAARDLASLPPAAVHLVQFLRDATRGAGRAARRAETVAAADATGGAARQGSD